MEHVEFSMSKPRETSELVEFEMQTAALGVYKELHRKPEKVCSSSRWVLRTTDGHATLEDVATAIFSWIH